jgi:phage N-6-adenine-methyltransferase
VRGTIGTGENEWFTPIEHIKLARKVLGAIDLDPATHEKAQTIVRAAQFFTKEDDGLKHQWHGRTWLNPPYAQPFIAQFVSKLCRERKAGRVTAAIMLTHNYTDTAWFREAASVADAICFTHGRIKFYEPDGTIAAPTQGQPFFYFGDDVSTFDQHFASIGFVLIPYVPVPSHRRVPR